MCQGGWTVKRRLSGFEGEDWEDFVSTPGLQKNYKLIITNIIQILERNSSTQVFYYNKSKNIGPRRKQGPNGERDRLGPNISQTAQDDPNEPVPTTVNSPIK